MARSITEIQENILSRLAAIPATSSINNTSATAVFRLLAYVVAVAANQLEVIMETIKAETFKIIQDQRVHGAQYYIDQAKLFQFSTETPQRIILDDYYLPRFENIDEELQIVTSVAVREANRKVFMKVNKGVPGALEVLDGNELLSFKNYMHLLKDIGTQIVVESLPPETLRMTIAIDYSSVYGSLINSDVHEIVNNYLVQMGVENKFSVQAFEAALLADARITDLKVTRLAAYTSTGNVTTIFDLSQGINLKDYLTVSGHMVLNTSDSIITLNAIL